MKLYPSIQGAKHAPRLPCIAFDKLDGSNLRFEWTKKNGFFKFGTRHRLFDHTDTEFGKAIPIFMQKYAEPLAKVFKDEKRFRNAQNMTVYAEFVGPHSFAGQHLPDDPMDVVLFDVNQHKYGFLGPRDFLKFFGHLHVPKVIYEGNLNEQFIADIRAGKYPVTFEGVVCKGGAGGTDLWLAKIKTEAYLEKLKAVFHERWMEFWE